MRWALIAVLVLGCSAFGPAPGTQLPLSGSNGCSNSPDLGPAVVCCDKHDWHYRTGGPLGTWTNRQRLASDRYLLACLTQFEEIPLSLAKVYYEMVQSQFGYMAWEENKRAAFQE